MEIAVKETYAHMLKDESLVQNAINKLSLVETYEEAASYKERLQKAIDRIATLPTESEWQAAWSCP